MPLPAEARPVDTSHPDVVIGAGTPASCTSQAVVDAVAHGGIITFDCGPDPVTIVMTDDREGGQHISPSSCSTEAAR